VDTVVLLGLGFPFLDVFPLAGFFELIGAALYDIFG
jgi:hypothetical protein